VPGKVSGYKNLCASPLILVILIVHYTNKFGKGELQQCALDDLCGGE
jgi:hypothetical protein